MTVCCDNIATGKGRAGENGKTNVSGAAKDSMRSTLTFLTRPGSLSGTQFVKSLSKAAESLGGAIARRPKWEIEAACLVLCPLIAAADYYSGQEISLSVVYAVPVMIAAWFVGLASALVFSFLSVAAWLFVTYPIETYSTQYPAAGMQAALWSGLIRFIVLSAFAAILARLNDLRKNVEAIAETRARALTEQIAERNRLEHEILEISERERLRIGQDLHDGLCQHLAGTAMVSQLLAQDLADESHSRAERARRIVDLTEEGISLARGIAKGLHPIGMQAGGLMQALEDFASTTSDLFGIICDFECNLPVTVHSASVSTHLYRIAQEGVSNAVRHGRASRIEIMLEETDNGIRLSVTDNGIGLPAQFPAGGLGLRTMAARAKFMGGQFSLRPAGARGARMICVVPGEGLTAPGGGIKSVSFGDYE